MKIMRAQTGAWLMAGAAALGAVGCLGGGAGADGELDASLVKSGIYSVYATPVSDTCLPKRPAGALGKSVVRVAGATIQVNVAPVEDATGRYAATRVSSFATDGDAASELSYAAVDPRCGEESMWLLRRELTSTEAGLLVHDLLDWSVGCPAQAAGGAAALGAMPSMPEDSCRSEQQVIFRLEAVCEAPCEVHARAAGELYCSCADAI